MKWFKITLPAAKTQSSQLRSLQDEFVEVFHTAMEPKNMALFSTDASPNTFYVCASITSVPYVRILIDLYEGSACNKPADEKLNILAGGAHGIDKLLQNTNT